MLARLINLLQYGTSAFLFILLSIAITNVQAQVNVHRPISLDSFTFYNRIYQKNHFEDVDTIFFVQISSFANREDAYKIRSVVLEQMPEISCEVIYQPPNFKLRITGFNSSAEANICKYKLTPYIKHQGIYIVKQLTNTSFHY